MKKKINQWACYNRIWSWSPMPCQKHGPRASVTTKTSAFGLGFCLLSPSGHVFHTAWETMIKSYNTVYFVLGHKTLEFSVTITVGNDLVFTPSCSPHQFQLDVKWIQGKDYMKYSYIIGHWRVAFQGNRDRLIPILAASIFRVMSFLSR